MTFDELITRQRAWVKDRSESAGVVISTRVRLARNVAAYPFTTRLLPDEQLRVRQRLKDMLGRTEWGKSATCFDMDKLTSLNRRLLLECRLISPEMANGDGAYSVLVSEDTESSVSVLDQDHLRIQTSQPGLALEQTWRMADSLDDEIEAQAVIAWNSRFGYLTTSPSQVGTGLNVYVMLHIPALVITNQFTKVYNSLQKLSLTARGLYGTGPQSCGHFYSISNQYTLGCSEQDILRRVRDVVQALVQYERLAMDSLWTHKRTEMEEKVQTAATVLRTQESISCEDAIRHLSFLRVGVQHGMFPKLPQTVIDQLLFHVRPAQLFWVLGGLESSMGSDELRGAYLNKYLERQTEWW